MGKGSKTRARAAKLAKKAELAGLPGLAPVTRREKDGRVRRSTKPGYERTEADVALRARCRQMGWPTRPEDMAKARAQSLECDAGRVLHLLCAPDEVGRLWGTFAGLCRAEASYARHYLGIRLHAKTARIEMMQERFEISGDDDLDLRSDEEKARTAVNRWMEWRGHIGHLDRWQEASIWGAVREQTALIRDGAATAEGRIYVRALTKLADVVERR
ncbi:hypothetical protein BYZ73_19315 [Rhodovulum viride]|uniref:Uncharacterized protein n=1 Tax=Rhodovulum viride TaxID=1231134 RepID=A0ABX9DDJ0_9RHOB|nr:hypothetical protein [Rhodovulum viride]RAP39671.1 hypothetical protein BYZ73_19315 [Rhodovulum viride]